MISSLQIEGYRGFEQFEMTDLGRLNLLVGLNNSGKTSVLEALYLLASSGGPSAMWQILRHPGEQLPSEPNNKNSNSPEPDVRHLFIGHEPRVGSKFTLSARNDTAERSITLSIAELKLRSRKIGMPSIGREVLEITGHPRPTVPTLALTRSGSISADAFDWSSPPRTRETASLGIPTQYVTPESLGSDDLVALWDEVVLTPNEALVERALQYLDPAIERIAAQSTQSDHGAVRGGFIVKRKGHEQPIPIGSLGDGMWRMMAMAIAITQCKGGILLIDEIDTGLHYTVMSDMWRLVFEAAKDLDVQVFATTHSFDCIHSLASVCLSGHDANNAITVQRIERGRPKAIPYSENEIMVAAKNNIEVR
jgi:hypothetical protein